MNFYQRKEIKDILAYLKIINNGQDDVAVRRVVNVPKRGIGATTVTKAAEYADQWGISCMRHLNRWMVFRVWDGQQRKSMVL